MWEKIMIPMYRLSLHGFIHIGCQRKTIKLNHSLYAHKQWMDYELQVYVKTKRWKRVLEFAGDVGIILHGPVQLNATLWRCCKPYSQWQRCFRLTHICVRTTVRLMGCRLLNAKQYSQSLKSDHQGLIGQYYIQTQNSLLRKYYGSCCLQGRCHLVSWRMSLLGLTLCFSVEQQ